MKKRLIASIALASAAIAANIYSNSMSAATDPELGPLPASAPKPGKTMTAFLSAAELKDYFKQLAEKQKRRADRREMAKSVSESAASPSVSMSVDTVGAAKDDESITNTQHAGVDEGGIVKVHGDHLLILRRGRLFTVRVGDDSLKPVTSIDAFAPGVDPSSDWYDEMLVSGDTVVVIGYSYGRGGTEINLFDIAAEGSLKYRSTYHLRSNDYYSSRNYASRLIGSKLVFYTPQYLQFSGEPVDQFPAIRRWHKGAKPDEFKPIVEATRVYRAAKASGSTYGGLALHTITVCDLADGGFACSASAVLGAPGRVFYVSPTSVYVWTTEWNYGDGRTKANSMLYKMPLDASAPSALGVMGSPVDQFSFLESDDKHLNVLVRSDGNGEQMWGSEFAAGDVALFRAPIDSFSDGSQEAPSHRYRELPKPEGYTFQNRFVGDHLLYGTGSGWGQPEQRKSANLFAIDYVNGDVNELWLKHGVDRIEQMGTDAVVIGTNGSDLYFSPIELNRDVRARESFVRKNASQGELRSHGFFYKPIGKDSGMLGLPIAREGRAGYRHLVEGSAAVTFLRNDRLDLTEMGELEAGDASGNDGCRASCVDWYGNARPVFLRNRIFALMGYEIVEGSVTGSRIKETRRINYSPQRGRAGNGE
ncbi:MAG TPA: beta-propeller domain-containing protein [Pyrinomonadaceae bacterium]|nr:beta-propeller domain-containing protein [Pyrinomonadaceae bacterium]